MTFGIWFVSFRITYDTAEKGYKYWNELCLAVHLYIPGIQIK